MNASDLINRYAMLYGDKFPTIRELERAINSSELSSVFKLVADATSSEEKAQLINDLRNITIERPNIHLLFRLMEAIDPDNEKIELLRHNIVLKSKIHETIDEVTMGQYLIPSGIRRLTSKFDGPALTDALSQGQIESKLWLVNTVAELDLDLGKMVYVCAGWYGVLAALMFERISNRFGKVYSFDIDPSTENPADQLNKEYVEVSSRFKAIVKDIHDLTYKNEIHDVIYYKYHTEQSYEINMTEVEADDVTCVINTSCEHVENFDEWWDNIPKGMLVIMQNNNFVEHDDHTVVNTIKSEQRWVDKLNVSKLLYRGTLSLPKYNRFMVIGRK